jgi:ABC-type multidrug transport system ATPase subunit
MACSVLTGGQVHADGILATLQEPDEGSIRLSEIDVLNQRDEVRKTLGYLPQEFGVYPKLSAGAPARSLSRCSRAFAALERWQTDYMPVYAVGRRSS